jgi:hypothetical protein
MKFYDPEHFCVVDLLFWAFMSLVATTCIFGIVLYFKN